jgi:hypothetical protein
MTCLPSGLASISSRLDDTPNVRGAAAFGRMVRENTGLQRAVDEHARLAVSSGCEGQIEAVARALWASRVRQAAAQGIDLERWGDGSVPKANGIIEDAEAAIAAIDRHAQLAVSAGYRSEDVLSSDK